jgi:ferredoxin
MAYVVTEVCVDCKYTSCAAVCPVEAFHEAPNALYINPDTCIDCNACMYECPIEAIFPDYEVPEKFKSWIQINADESAKHPIILNSKEALKGPKCSDPSK